MKSTILLQSASKNKYLFDKEQKMLLYCPTPLYDILSNNPNTTIGNENEPESNDLFDDSYEYYYKKSLLLKENGFLIEESENTIGLINEELIRKQIANLIQLTFEVTDACNLKCKYCGYGEFYGNHDQRENRMLPISYAKRIINYLIPYWESNEDLSYIHTVNLGFYGGEPLINFEFIKEVVAYIKELKLTHVRFDYSMTTNALLLKKHAAFLSENNFEILVSLDGNEFNNSYRVDHRNKTVFNNIIDNVKWVQMHYPKYFSDKINFNAVLHNRNSISEINSFFQNEFGKTPSIGELNTVGIRSDKTKEFYSMYKNKVESLHQSENYTDIENHFFLGMPDPKNLFVFLNQYSDNVYKSYNNFFSSQQSFKLPTGTCLPFGKKNVHHRNRKDTSMRTHRTSICIRANSR